MGLVGGFSGTQVNFAAGRRWDARADFWDSSGGFGGTMHRQPGFQFQDLHEQQMIRAKDIARLLAVSPDAIYRMAGEGRFPRAIKLADRVVVWRLSEVKAWIEKKAEARE